MSLKASDFLNDPLVKQTIDAISANGGRRSFGQDDVDSHPIIALLEKTGGLDSQIASVLVAEEMLRGSDVLRVAHLLPPGVGDAVRVLQNSGRDPGASMTAMIDSGDATLLKLATAAIAYTGTGAEFAHAKSQGGGKVMVEMLDISIEITDALSQDGRWKAVPAPLLKTLVEAVENFSEFAQPKLRKQLAVNTVDALRAALAKEGVDLPALAVAPAELPPAYNPSMKVTEVLNDPLVLQSLQSAGLGPQDANLGNYAPLLDILASVDSLDSIAAASIVMMDARRGATNLPREVREVVDVLGNDMMAYAGPGALFGTDNATLHKIGMASLANAVTPAELARAQNELRGSQLKEQMGEVADAMMLAVERVVEAKTYATMSPKLVDKFAEGLEAIKPYAEGKTLKRLLTLAGQSLKDAIAKDNAASITAPQQKPGKAAGVPKPKKGGAKLQP